jgi:hypothetical protein
LGFWIPSGFVFVWNKKRNNSFFALEYMLLMKRLPRKLGGEGIVSRNNGNWWSGNWVMGIGGVGHNKVATGLEFLEKNWNEWRRI